MQQQAGSGLIDPLVALGVLAIIVAVAVSECDEQKKWQEYAAQNNCTVISTEKGTWYSVPDGNGGSTSHRHADRTTYRCEDGTTHTR